MELSKIEIITSSSKLSKLQSALTKVGVTGMTVMQAIGCGVQRGTYEYLPEENVEMELLPKTYIMLIVEDHIVEKAVETIKKELYTGHIGDGKIFVSPITNVIRVRTGEEGLDALK
ncbi:MAG: P-II family nitrogen regulator [Clostridia bacterium]|nr:P-II family nitrogen regulator [Clostridia bacterium]